MNKLIISENRPPIFVAAGVIKHEAQIIQASQVESVAMQTIGSFTRSEWSGNSMGGKFNVFHWDEATKAAYNSIGLENPGRKLASEYLPRAISFVKESGQLAVVSVTTLGADNPKTVLPDLVEWALEMGADGVEINGSCPNLDPKHALLCQDVGETITVLNAVRDRVGAEATLGLKVSELGSHIIRAYRSHPDFSVDFVTAINTKGAQPSPTNPNTKQPYIEVNEGLAGMSGPVLAPLARDNLALWTRPRIEGSFDVLSAGGIDSSFNAGTEINSRLELGALMVGGAQEFYRKDVRPVAETWAMQYVAALPA